MFDVLANRTFRALFSAQVIALLGTGLTTIGFTLLAYDIAKEDAGIILGTALALKMIAYVSIAPVIGGLAHRLPRKPLLIALDLCRAGFVLCLPFVTEIWQIYVLIFLLNGCSAGFTPTFQAAIPDVLPDEGEYTRGLSLSRLAHDLENLLSPTLAAAALVFLSYDALFAANAVAFVLSALLVMTVVLPAPAIRERFEGVWHNVSSGVRGYLKTPRLRALFALSIAVAAAGSMVIINTVIMVRGDFGGTETDVATAFVAVGAGSIVAALGLPRLLEKISDRTVMLSGGALLGGGLLLGHAVTGFMSLLALWFVLGIGSSLVQTPAGRLLRRSAADAGRPAIYSAQFAMSHACWLVAYPLAGWLGASFGQPAAFSTLAALAVISTAAALFVWPRNDPVEIDHSHAPMEHGHLHIHGDHHHHEHEGWEGPEPHRHPHRHDAIRHTHRFVIDAHHPIWPTR